MEEEEEERGEDEEEEESYVSELSVDSDADIACAGACVSADIQLVLAERSNHTALPEPPLGSERLAQTPGGRLSQHQSQRHDQGRTRPVRYVSRQDVHRIGRRYPSGHSGSVRRTDHSVVGSRSSRAAESLARAGGMDHRQDSKGTPAN